jgi:hypothetical protein
VGRISTSGISPTTIHHNLLAGQERRVAILFFYYDLVIISCVIQINFPTALLNDEDLEALQMVRIEVRSINVSHF